MIDGLKFLGRHIHQDEESLEVTTNMNEYCSEFREVAVDPQGADSTPLDAAQVGELRSCVGLCDKGGLISYFSYHGCSRASRSQRSSICESSTLWCEH